MWSRPAALLLLFLAACPHPSPPGTAATDPAAALATARAEVWNEPSMGRFSIRLGLPDRNMSASGLLILAPPSRFRLELRGPVGGPALIVASDGVALNAWVASSNTAYRAPEADVALRTLTGGLLGLDAVVSVLGGRLPASDGWQVGPGSLRLSQPGSGSVDVVLDARTSHLLSVSVLDTNTQPVLSANLLPGKDGPEMFSVEILRLGASATLNFDAWEPYTPSEAVFQINTPPDAVQRSFDELFPAKP